MAETTDRPPNPKTATASLPTAPPAAPDEAPQTYSSLSLLAIAGLAVAAVYGLVVVGCGAIALFNRTPLILPLWSLAAPLAAVLVCWAARVRIQNSEGALTGTRLTTVGLWLSLVVGLLYAAYYSACYLSIAQMAGAVGDEWFDHLKNNRLDQAYLMTLPPPRPSADAGLRARLELDYDHGPRGSGPFTDFRQSEIVRQLQQGGAADQVRCLGVKEWSNTAGGGYQVQLSYRVSTPALITEMVLTVVGVEDTDDAGGRQWYVKNTQPTGTPQVTDEGRRMMDRADAAREFAQTWLNKVIAWRWKEAYRDTLPPAERQGADADHGPKFDAGLKAFREGALVRAEPPLFWAGDKETAAKIVAGVKGLFGHGESSERLSLAPSMPTYRRDGDQIRLGFDLAIPLPPNAVQAQLVVEADAEGEANPDAWRVESLDLISGKSLGAASEGPPRPGLPGLRR